MRSVALSITLITILSSTITSPAWSQVAELNGSVDVSAVQAEVDGVEQSTLQQRYTVNASRRLTEALDARASLRYFKFDIDQAEQLGVFREEFQPSGELAWRAPWFRASLIGLQRSVRTPALGRVITENVVADWRSLLEDWPRLTLRYDWQKIHDEADQSTRDTRDRRFLARLDVQRENESLEYSFSRRWTENFIRDLESRENAHQLRYLGSHVLDEARRLRIDSQYLFTRRDRTDEVRTGTVLLERVEVPRTLFAVDPAPELGTLEPVPALGDGNTAAATVPPVEIGTGSIDRNLGADFGIRREALAAVFVYVDRFSSATVDWSVWISDDGLDWDQIESTPIRGFNTPLLRYEIEFPEQSARYLKVVNSGNNDVADVLVTELEFYEATRERGEVERDDTSHLASASLRWRATDDTEIGVDTSVRLEPQSGSVGDREGYDYGIRARWQQTSDLQWIARWEQAFERFEETRAELRDDVLTATALYDPIPTLGTTVSGSQRRSFEGGRRLRTISNLFAAVDAEPVPAVDVVVDGTVGRVENEFDGTWNDQWTVRSSLDTEVTRWLRVLGSWTHQQITTEPVDDLTVRRTWTLDVDLQLTERIFARMGTTWVEESDQFSRRQDYLLNWRVGPRLVLTGQAILDDATNDFRSDRLSFNATFEVNSRTTAYVRYAEVVQRVGEEERTESWQQGLRMTF